MVKVVEKGPAKGAPATGQNTARWIRVTGEKASQFNPGPPITVSIWALGYSYPIRSYETIIAKGDTSWTLQTVGLSPMADNQPTVFLRWGMGPTDPSVTYPGWNIDDIVINGTTPINACPADFNRDGVVDTSDVIDFLNAWYPCLYNGGLFGDFDKNGVVNTSDIISYLNVWFDALTNGC